MECLAGARVVRAWSVLILLCVVVSCRGEDNVIRFNKGEVTMILDHHNDLRRSITNAANMRKLTWNEGIAIASAEWGLNCDYRNRPDAKIGQNMNYFYGTDMNKSPGHLFRHSFNAWKNQSTHYDYTKYKYCGNKNVCSFVQLIAADVQQVGCSIVQCPSLLFRKPRGRQANAKILVCFYSPCDISLETSYQDVSNDMSLDRIGPERNEIFQTVDFTVDITSKNVYVEGSSCSACPEGTECVDNLCSTQINHLNQVPSIGTINIKVSSGVGKVGNTPDIYVPRRRTTKNDKHGKRKHRNRNTVEHHHSNRKDNNLPTENNGVHGIKGQDSVIYKNNNRVMPFPGRAERRDIRKIERAERYLEKHDNTTNLAEFVQRGPSFSHNNTTEKGNIRKKRQLSYQDARYQRRLEYERYLRDYERHLRQREEARRQYEMELRRRQSNAYRVQELRRLSERDRYEEERRRRQRLREQRRRLDVLALIQGQGELTGEEQFFTVTAHNVLRREVGARELAWNTNLERWAKYVIRCETEYPGPISCFTNFGKANQGDDIYSLVYQWGTEGYDMDRPMLYGCRTPYDKSLCNHNSIIRDKSLTQMACASRSCGINRQLTCIYNSS